MEDTKQEVIARVEAEAMQRAGVRLTDSARYVQAVETYPPIESQDEAELYAGELVATKKRINELEEERTFLVGPLNESLRRINGRFKGPRENYERAETILKGLISTYQIRMRKEAEEKQRAAEQAAREEQARIAKEAAEREAAARAELERGNVDKAQELAEQAQAQRQEALSVAPAVIEEPRKVAGVTMSRRWKANVLSKRSLIEYIATHPEFDELLEIRQSAIDGLARSMKDKMRIPGLEAVPVDDARVTGK